MTAVTVHHVEDGSPGGPALILSNSMGTTPAIWDPQMPNLIPSFRVIRYDLRGHGRSPVPPAPYAIEDLGADLLGLLDALDVARAHLCGASLGGMVSMWVAAHAPERVARLVLCCTSASFGNPPAWRERAAAVRTGGTGAVARTVVGRWFTPAFASACPDVVAGMETMLAATPAEGYAACCEVVARTDLSPDLGAIRAPTLIVAGDRDPAAPLDHAERLVRGIAGSRLSIVQDAAHLAGVERPDVVTDLILSHLREDPTPGTSEKGEEP